MSHNLKQILAGIREPTRGQKITSGGVIRRQIPDRDWQSTDRQTDRQTDDNDDADDDADDDDDDDDDDDEGE